MKKIYTLITFVAAGLFCTAFAQQQFTNLPIAIPGAKLSNSPPPSTMATDTLRPPSWTLPCNAGDTSWFYSWDRVSPKDSGYVDGNDKFGATECAQKYNATGTVTEVLVYYAHLHGTNGTTTAKIYSVNATTKKPLSVIGTSTTTITTGNLASTFLGVYGFSSPVSVNGYFDVAVEFPSPTSGDTVVVSGTKFQCAGTPADSLSWSNETSFGGWMSSFSLGVRILKNAYTYAALVGYNFTHDLFIFPVVTIASGMNEYPSSNGLTLMGAYPNPAQDFTNIRFKTIVPAVVSAEVFDLTGRIIEKSSETLAAGTHDMKVSLKGIAPGNYYYTVNTGSAQLTSKFVVTK